MDSWIITRLESLMARSRVSPYDVARFFAVGAVFGMLPSVVQAAVRHQWVDLLLPGLWMPLWLPMTESMAKTAEQENARGFINSHKRGGWCRVAALCGFVLTLPAALLNHAIVDVSCSVYAFSSAAFWHFVALNWTPPPRKAVKAPAWLGLATDAP